MTSLRRALAPTLLASVVVLGACSHAKPPRPVPQAPTTTAPVPAVEPPVEVRPLLPGEPDQEPGETAPEDDPTTPTREKEG